MEVTSTLQARAVLPYSYKPAWISFRLYRAACTNLPEWWTNASGSEETTAELLSVTTSELLNCLYMYFHLTANPSADTTSFTTSAWSTATASGKQKERLSGTLWVKHKTSRTAIHMLLSSADGQLWAPCGLLEAGTSIRGQQLHYNAICSSRQLTLELWIKRPVRRHPPRFMSEDIIGQMWMLWTLAHFSLSPKELVFASLHAVRRILFL